MKKETIKNLKVCAATALLTGSIILIPTQLIKANSVDNREEVTELVTEEITETKIFEPGEHIISVPINDINTYYEDSILPSNDSAYRIECPEGYEIIGTSKRQNEQTHYIFSNIVPVEVKDKGNKSFTDFGTPIEYEKTKKL